MALTGQTRVKAPEHLDDAQGTLADRLRNVTTRRRHGADGGHGAVFAREGVDTAGSLVEFGDAGGEVRGVAFLTGHLFQTRGNLTHGLGPAGGRVGHEGHVVAHVTEVFGDGDAGVHRRFTRSHRHVGGVRDHHGPVHQRLAGVRVDQVRELVQHFGHLVAALTAADVDHDLCVRVLRKGLLGHGLPGSERTGNTGCTALGEREQEVEDAHSSDEGGVRRVLRLEGARRANGPLLHHLNLGAVLEGGDRLGDVEIAALDALDGARHVGWDHDLVDDGLGFLHVADDVAARDRVTDGSHRLEGPGLLHVEGVSVDTTGDEEAHLLLERLERTLDTVVNLGEQTGSQRHREGLLGVQHGLTRTDAGGVFIHLNDGLVAVDFDHFAHQAFFTDTYDVVHGGTHALGRDHRPGNAVDLSFFAHSSSSNVSWNVMPIGRLRWPYGWCPARCCPLPCRCPARSE